VAKKTGQLAHVDRNSSNSTFENAAFLCTTHHAEYDSRSRQTKGLTLGEVRYHRDNLYNYLLLERSARRRSKPVKQMRKPKQTTLEVYDRRLPVYRLTRQFVRGIVREAKVDYNQIFKFAEETDEALFLFGQDVDEYLSLIYRKAVRFRAVSMRIEHPKENMDVGALAAEDSEFLLWFSEQLKEMRNIFFPYLNL
jgi:hypothetical protein